MRRHVSTVALVALIAFAAPARAGVPKPGFVDTEYVGGLAAPIALAFLPDDTLLIAEKGGNLKHFDGNSTTTLVTIPVCAGSEMGLLGVAIDPNFGSNGFIYLYRTKAGMGGCGTSVGRFNQVVRVTMSGGSVAIGSLVELLDGIRTDNGNHDGGVLRIGPDGKLWVGVGDTGNGDNVGGPGSATNPYAQDLGDLEGKVLRLNLDGTAPADNPFVGMGGARPEVWAYGFRNPFRMSFDGATGDLWVADVGDLTVEEVNIGVAGGNYSWPRCEGNLQGPPMSPQPCVVGADVAPVFTYPHSGGSSLGTCVIGGDFAGAAFGGMAGHYVFGDCTASVIYHVALNAMRNAFVGSPVEASTNAGTPSDFVVGPDGAIYYAAVSAGDVRRLAGLAAGVDTLVDGKSLSLRDNPAHPSRKSISTGGKDTTIDLGSGVGSADDPTLNGGSLRVVSVAGGFDDTYPLPASGWSYIGKAVDGKGYRYKDTKQLNGPVKAAIVRNGKMLRATAKGTGLGHTLAANPNPVSIVLETGAKDYCMNFGGTTTFKANTYFKAKFSPAPGACPP